MTGADRLDGKVALVTGASQGIGAAIAAALAAAGAHVVLASRNEAALSRQVKAITGDGGLAVAMRTDVTSEPSVRGLLAGIRSRFGRLDAAVNNAAGGGRPPAPLAEWTSDQFDSAIGVNLRGTFLCLKYELELMNEAAHGAAIVNMSSTAGEQGVAGLSGYVASKFGIGGLTRVAALDYAASGIRVNAIAPGPILTGRLAAAVRPSRPVPRRPCRSAGLAASRRSRQRRCGCARTPLHLSLAPCSPSMAVGSPAPRRSPANPDSGTRIRHEVTPGTRIVCSPLGLLAGCVALGALSVGCRRQLHRP
jgi:NAD(P)-dependent dehydrogenase (short-subunit alcohol dehydrogenase family)